MEFVNKFYFFYFPKRGGVFYGNYKAYKNTNAL